MQQYKTAIRPHALHHTLMHTYKNDINARIQLTRSLYTTLPPNCFLSCPALCSTLTVPCPPHASLPPIHPPTPIHESTIRL